KIAYACLSKRTSIEALKEWEKISGYTAITFRANDETGFPIYHTNVIMTLTDKFAILCEESIFPEDIQKIKDSISSSGREILSISFEQTKKFCGNCIELLNRKGEHLLIMSEQARNAFTNDQIQTIENSCRIVSSDLSEIESIGGGGARCMIAELF
ncbi:MAG: amidinotransferase, partial [Bacteroidia bacterium]|nr:amidinotransferase [Bacteroidia bacterium]